MELTITNLGTAGTVLSTVNGSAPKVEELGAGMSTFVTGDCTIAIVGDKPDLAEQLGQVAAILGELLQKILAKLRARQKGRAPIEPAPLVHIAIDNRRGRLPVRAILGDGITDAQIAPGLCTELQGEGYIELRELGDVPQSDDPAQQQGQTVA
jgi:hypothetical protein